MKSYQTVLFDLDGTITDSKPGILRCIRLALDAHGISYTQEVLDKMVGPPFRVSMREFFGIEGEIVEDLIRIYRAEYEIDGWRECVLYSGVTELFERLTAAGKRLAVATSKPLKFTEKMIDELGLRKYFEFVGGAESDSSRDSKREVIEYVFKNMGDPDRASALMIGDRLYDVDGARQCGIDSMGVLWGYGSRSELESHGVDYICASPAEAGDLILGDR